MAMGNNVVDNAVARKGSSVNVRFWAENGRLSHVAGRRWNAKIRTRYAVPDAVAATPVMGYLLISRKRGVAQMSTISAPEDMNSVQEEPIGASQNREPRPTESGKATAANTDTAPGIQTSVSDGLPGVLSVEIKALPIIAGTRATVTLVLRNPFPEEVIIESIEAPSSEPLLPRAPRSRFPEADTAQTPSKSLTSVIRNLLSNVSAIGGLSEVRLGPLVASFPGAQGRRFNVDLAAKSKLILKSPFGPQDTINIKSADGAHIVFDVPEAAQSSQQEARVIPAHQDDIASFELRTAHWLFVTPKVLDLYAVIRYRVGGAHRSQVVPFSVTVRPPLTAIMCGSVAGGILGYFARQLTSASPTFEYVPTAVSILGIIVMATISSIVLSRQDNAKGFVTLEDFYGAFVVGVLLGYTGTSYFETVLKSVGPTPKL